MFDPVKDVEEFHEKFGLRYAGPPRTLEGELGEFRTRFLQEELNEYRNAQDLLKSLILNCSDYEEEVEITNLLEDQLDALVDLVYVALGNAHLHGFNFREAWRRVHEANMRKIRATHPSDSKRGTTFDVVKPPGWVAPSHFDLVHHHPYRRA
jgi:predicted HAD superfamily Cof-like phosphohydrolase